MPHATRRTAHAARAGDVDRLARIGNPSTPRIASIPRKSGYVFMMNGDNAAEIFKTLGYGDTPLNGFVMG